MEDSEEVDILGDFDFKSGGADHEDDAELPSKSVQLLPEFSQHPWLLEQGWTLDNCADEKSRAAIEKMLIEEQYLLSKLSCKLRHAHVDTLYIQCRRVDGRHVNVRSASTHDNLHEMPPKAPASRSKPDNGRRKLTWTEEERTLFYQGLEVFGRRWSKIAELIPSRTHQQVKNFAVHHLKHKGRKVSSSHSVATTSVKQDDRPSDMSPIPTKKGKGFLTKEGPGPSIPESEVVRISYQSNSDSENEEIDVESASEDEQKIPNFTSTPVDETGDFDKNTGTCTISEISEEFEEQPSPKNDAHAEHRSQDHGASQLEPESNENLSLSDSVTSEDDNPTHDTGQVPSEVTVVYLPQPTQAMTIDRTNITDQEREVHSEFFDGRRGRKTPERYLCIRNHILDCWYKCRPGYLNKTSVRSGLKNCGDVNCISRIHGFLEQTGAINFGCEQVQYNIPLMLQPGSSKRSKDRHQNRSGEMSSVVHMENMRVRKRRVRDAFGDWVDEKDLEGKTIDHNLKKQDKSNTRPKTKTKPQGKSTTYDPFKLIPCLRYGAEHQAPFRLTMEAPAVFTMDVHSHLSKTEVIGLLGGTFRDGHLVVMTAEPCDSISTGMQCEMDPVSQNVASERILEAGQAVVGWYHSHPMFIADPSVRDVETQLDFQQWFSTDGGAFIGAIVNPYNSQSPATLSDIRCLVVETEGNICATGRPFQFEFSVTAGALDVDSLTSRMKALANQYVVSPSRVELLQSFQFLGNMTCLEKMMHSLEQRMRKVEITPESDSCIKLQFSKLTENIRLAFHEIYSSQACTEGDMNK